jgi:predicted esterase
MTAVARTPSVEIHGRYLIDAPPGARGPLLVGFHGYAENAEIALERLQSIPRSDPTVLVSVQGLHRFYRGRSNDVVVAGWMTKQDRDLAIADNLAYVRRVIDDVSREHPDCGAPVYAGFSQGVAMAFRAAAGGQQSNGVIAVGGDVPPELEARALAAIPSVLLARGTRDEWYTAAKFRDDVRRLEAAGVQVTACEFEMGHEWTPLVSRAAAEFLSA